MARGSSPQRGYIYPDIHVCLNSLLRNLLPVLQMCDDSIGNILQTAGAQRGLHLTHGDCRASRYGNSFIIFCVHDSGDADGGYRCRVSDLGRVKIVLGNLNLLR